MPGPTAARAVHLSPTRRLLLRTLAIGLCAAGLCATPVVASASSSAGADSQLAHHVGALEKSASVIRFFQHHRWLLKDARFGREATRRLRAARRDLAAARADAARARARIERSERAAMERRLLAEVERSPTKAICHVFGARCQEALRVARCESGYRTTAQNGQYLGLFQMGSSERQLFGHGETALAQARAAYRYFVRSGRDWSPWSCKPWH
jgi:hypothetical protein